MLAITLDIDWAPDYAIDEAAGRLRDAGVKATWFVTHASPAVDRLRATPELFELGVHPNFFAGSEHGASLDAVLAHVKELVPEARSIRSHGLYQSGRLLAAIAADDRLETDVSLFLPGHPHLRPVTLRLPAGTIVRVPYFWSDDHEMAAPDPAWSLDPLLAGSGLKVLNFHPVHVFLNAADTGPYAAVQAASPSLREADRTLAEGHVHAGPGTRTVFDEVVEHLAGAGSSATISDIARAHAAG
jgi:polysaccharide deactylase WbmS-like protein